jgi:Bacteroidetes VLRF1 release factor
MRSCCTKHFIDTQVHSSSGLPSNSSADLSFPFFFTARRKQGGSQSVNDNAKGNAHSAGVMLRHCGEQALRDVSLNNTRYTFISELY